RAAQPLPDAVDMDETDIAQQRQLLVHRVGVLAAAGRSRLAVGSLRAWSGTRIRHRSVALHEERIPWAHIVQVEEAPARVRPLLDFTEETALRVERDVVDRPR